jgi:hypothetical protein
MKDERYDTRREGGARLEVQSAIGRSRKIIRKKDQFLGSRRVHTGRLEMNAWVGQRIPLGLMGAKGVSAPRQTYPAVAGEKISYRAARFREGLVTTGSSTHKIQTCTLDEDVLCVVLLPLAGLH